MFLTKTIEDILEHAETDIEIIAVLDGEWADPPVPQNERVTLLHYPESIGQRAACNVAARIATGKYLMKLDAHCGFSQGFDRILLEDMQPGWCCAPLMKNLHAFNWKCPNGHIRYQGPSGPCLECKEPTTRDVIWYSKPSPNSTSYCFDTTLHFNYFGNYKNRPEGRGDITETMSLQGSCFMISKEQYFDLNICDESWGSWGQQGAEVALKVWLSGGRVVVNHKTFYSHMFRTQGGDFSFPYHNPQSKVEDARKICRDLFLNNKWDKQIYPLSWLIEKFKPVPDWHDESGREVLERVTMAGAIFSSSTNTTNSAKSIPTSIGISNIGMPINAGGFSGIDSAYPNASKEIFPIGNKSQMIGVTTSSISTDVIQDGNISTISNRNGTKFDDIHKPMSQIDNCIELDLPISESGMSASPVPASSIGINNDSGIESTDLLVGKGGNCEIIDVSHLMPPIQVSGLESVQLKDCTDSIISPTKGIVYYTDNRLDPGIMKACQEQLLKSVNGYRIVSVSLQPIYFEDNIVVPLERGYLTMFKQILTGLEELNTDIVYFCEHDVLYSKEHFEFIPPEHDKYYYNKNWWKLRLPDGHCLQHDGAQTSGLCAYRDTLIKHYKQRVINTEKMWNELGGNTHPFRSFIRDQGFEPGTHHRAVAVDNLGFEYWSSEVPIIDVRHNGNLTANRWSIDQFRRKPKMWVESDTIPYWGKGIDIVRRLT
jgi:hypothetical protein